MGKQRRKAGGSASRVPIWVIWTVGAVGAAVLVLWLVLVVPRFLVPTASTASLRDVNDAAKRHELQDNRLKLQNDVRTTLLQGLGGLAIIAGAVFTYRQLRVTREGQVTDRFTKAIDQLDEGKGLAVRLGGLYALERIAKDSQPDRNTVAEVLCAYVRTQAPWPEKSTPEANRTLAAAGQNLDRTKGLQDLIARLPDVYATSRILGRWHKTIGPPPVLSLHNADLRRAALRGDHFPQADFRCTNLQEADLSGAHLEGAHLEDAILVDAWLRDVVMTGAYLQRADLSGAHLEGAHLRGAEATADTIWPRGFDWEAAGVVIHAASR
jgi:hypothetical protein